MKNNVQEHEKVNMALRRLEQYATLSPFCRQFYRAIYDWLGAPGLEAQKLDHAFRLFLRCECKRHHAIAHFIHQGKLDLLEIVRIGRMAHQNLDRICKALSTMEIAGRRERMLRHLILAECHYHLGNTEAVIHSLRTAIRTGCAHPLAHFALGYNLYQAALERFSVAGKRKGEFIITNPRAFEVACRQTVAAFKRGLGDWHYDAQLSWWIGLVSEILGERDSAYDAFQRAKCIDPENFSALVDVKTESLDQSPIMRSPSERERLARLSPIGKEELDRAREHLNELHGPQDLFPETDSP